MIKEQEKLKKLEEQIAILKARKQKLLNKEKEQERKERTKRLIKLGATVEKILGTRTADEFNDWIKKNF
ncbi:TPA: hypothetical protein QCU60_005212 [Bacillus cereus]|nr:hypothetical protein [Bacillus cereus]